jgi:pimeloyl-ACP methyl ester carboxylesterase
VHLLTHDWSSQLALMLVPKLGARVKAWVALNPFWNLPQNQVFIEGRAQQWQLFASRLSNTPRADKWLQSISPNLTPRERAWWLSHAAIKSSLALTQAYEQWMLKPQASEPFGVSLSALMRWRDEHAGKIAVALTPGVPWSQDAQQEHALFMRQLNMSGEPILLKDAVFGQSGAWDELTLLG